MAKQPFISAYTPSNMDPELREAILVQRHKLLDLVVKWLTKSDNKHLLFIGPRGCGKTMLVSMVEHRISQLAETEENLRIAWLGEDDVITGLIDLAVAIAQALIKRYPGEFSPEIINQVKGRDRDEAANIILHTIAEQLGDRKLLLIMENLDLSFRGLQDQGQKQWRAFLQETGRVKTLATSQQLFTGVSSRDAAFFGFFDVHHLEPLSCEEARLLVRNIAQESGKQDLVEFLDSSTGRYRIRALHHLAGGNHRLYIELSAFLTVESLDGFVEALESLADELTPYFQERIRSLPPQQAKIVQWLCDFGGAASVKAISEGTFIHDRTVSKQLAELKSKGYVLSHRRGRESYFEMAEPLMRLSMETKGAKGGPLRLIASFLKVWFSEAKLKELCLQSSSTAKQKLEGYYETTLHMDADFLEDINEQLFEQFRNHVLNKSTEASKELLLELMETPSGSWSGLIGAMAMIGGEYYKEALELIQNIEKYPGLKPKLQYELRVAKGQAYANLKDYPNALEALTQAVAFDELERIPSINFAYCYMIRSAIYAVLGQFEQSFEDVCAVLKHEPAKPLANQISIIANGLMKSTLDVKFKYLLANLIIDEQAIFDIRVCFELLRLFHESCEKDGYLQYSQKMIEHNLLNRKQQNLQVVDISVTLIFQIRKQQKWDIVFLEQLVELYHQHGKYKTLNLGLVYTAAELIVNITQPTQISAWISYWEGQSQIHEELEEGFMVLKAVEKLLIDNDDRAFLALPREVREVFKEPIKHRNEAMRQAS